MKVEMVRNNNVVYDLSRYTDWELESMYAAEYEHWTDGDSPYSFVRMEKIREEIIKRKERRKLEDILIGVI